MGAEADTRYDAGSGRVKGSFKDVLEFTEPVRLISLLI